MAWIVVYIAYKRARILRVECDLMLGIRQQKLGAFKFSFWKAHQFGVSERKKPLFIAHEKKVKVDLMRKGGSSPVGDLVPTR